MKKISGLIILATLFFSVNSFAGNPPTVQSGNNAGSKLYSPTVDTAKKMADTASDDDEDDNVRSYAIGLDMGNDQSSHGVHSGSRLPYIEPNFTYTAPSGFYTEVMDQYFFMGKGKGFNSFGINPGWNISITDNSTWNINLAHYFLGSSASRKLPSSDISNAAETYFSQYIGETEGRFTIDYDYYSKTSRIQTPNDWIFTPDVNHTFKIKLGEKSSLELIPEASFEFGTRNGALHFAFNNGDTAQVYKKQQKQQITVTQSASFGTLDYNLIFTVNLKIGHFEFEPALNITKPLYAIPGESETPFGYMTLSLIYTIY